MKIEGLFRYKCNYPFISSKYAEYPYKEEEKEWFMQWTKEHSIDEMEKFKELRDSIR